MDTLIILLIVVSLINSAVSLLVSVITLIAAMQLIRYARDTDKLLDEIIITLRQLGKTIELAIWRS